MGLDPATAMIGSTLIGGLLQDNSTGNAVDAQNAASDAANKLQKEMYDAAVARNAPFVGGGVSAFNALMDRLGLSGNVNAPGYGSFGKVPTAADVTAEPGYQFGLDQGQQALDRSLNARGMRYSGAALKAADRYGTDYGSTKYNDAFNRLQGAKQQAYNQIGNIANLGQNAANNVGQAGANYASNVGQNIIGAGNAQAAGQLAQGNILGNAINQGVSLYNTNRLFNMLQPSQLAGAGSLGTAGSGLWSDYFPG